MTQAVPHPSTRQRKDMKLQRTLAALIFGLSAFAHAAPADDMLASALDNLYVGVNGSLFDAPTVLGVGGHVGALLHPNLAAEARLGLGLGDDNSVEIDNYVAFLAKGILPIDSNLAVYGVAGLARVRSEERRVGEARRRRWSPA